MKSNSSFPTIEAYLTLLSIQPRANRYRSYRIQIRTLHTATAFYIVTLSWGHQSIPCENKKELYRLISRVLHTRLRHQYQILEKSTDFPDLEIIKRMKTYPLFIQQYNLF